MTEHAEGSRTISRVRTGTKVAAMEGLSLMGLAAYFYFAPVYLLKAEGGVFVCGSAASPNTEADTICGAPESLNQARALASLGIGLLVILLGFAFFGLERDRNDAVASEWDEDIDLRDEDRDRDRDRDEDEDEERGAALRGAGRGRPGRSRAAEDVGESRADEDTGADVEETRSSRRGGRRSVLRDDDFADPAPRRRREEDPAPRRRVDDDWSSDGWR